ncbi:MAG: hypothetical protein J6K29_02045 [Clostridia bacterium]|nr:hypothetical protein [Clostridia bacterium]
MIDKNDVKMPVQKKDEHINQSKDQIDRIEELLRLVNEADNRQELRLKQDYYAKFHWFGKRLDSEDRKSYFSYQEEAVYDFVFNLNKSGILSDQVGMGKTIEAGMIISELASRNELRSLLIIVPNEIMARKWEYELSSKFGIQKLVTENSRKEKIVYPEARSVKNFDEFARLVFDCMMSEKFRSYYESITEDYTDSDRIRPAYSYIHQYKNNPAHPETMAEVLSRFLAQDIEETVKMINEGLMDQYDDGSVQVVFDGKSFSITGTDFSVPYTYDADGDIARFIRGRVIRDLEREINVSRFFNIYRNFLMHELCGLLSLIGYYFMTIPEEMESISKRITKEYPILIIPIAYSDYSGDEVKLSPFLNRVLQNEVRSYKHEYNIQTANGMTESVYEPYRVIDFFIDVGYQTLIVDEVHDYIDADKKMSRKEFHANNGYSEYPSETYNRYELFDDYYFVPKNSLYKKLKALADQANRKIFLTATPIKSDMVDFYLLTLLASNKDSEDYRRISEVLQGGSGMLAGDMVEQTIHRIYDSFKSCVETETGPYFCSYCNEFLRLEERDSATRGDKHVERYVYPYFNNDYLKANVNHPDKITEYLNSHISYMSVEEIVMELILAYMAETQENVDIVSAMNRLIHLLGSGADFLQTRVIFRALLNNTVKLRFEEDFTKEDGQPIKRIRELLAINEGPRKWHKTYRKYGIRHTRHQTYNLAQCDKLECLNQNKIDRFRNLPLWPRRNGRVIYLYRDDVFFDSFLDVRRPRPTFGNTDIVMSDLPNIDKIAGEDHEKQERFDHAVDIFQYINDAMSGGDPINHEPLSRFYDAVELDDAGMVDFKLTMISRLMGSQGSDLGSIKGKVLLFAEHDREKILEWFRYQKCAPLFDPKQGDTLDPKKEAEYAEKWSNYRAPSDINRDWAVTESAEDMDRFSGNLLVVIDPKRYEKGVDLQKANTMINFDINYCPLKMEQRIGRIDRIRPSDQNQQIDIISFVPLNNMSGYVINFFANELKMFTQWMGETTGIVSVPDEDTQNRKGGESVAFEEKVEALDKFYTGIYDLCRIDVDEKTRKALAKQFVETFRTNDFRTDSDFRFLQQFKNSFDKAFRNSLSTKRQGYRAGKSNERVMRFNCTNGIFADCASDKCEGCSNRENCNDKQGIMRNKAKDFVAAVQSFYKDGAEFYKKELTDFKNTYKKTTINDPELRKEVEMQEEWLTRRQRSFASAQEQSKKLMDKMKLERKEPGSFTVPLESFDELFTPMKKLYWDDTVMTYLQHVLKRFHDQCDSVLKSAALFEKFVKTLAVADFMNNMEGNV